MVTPFLRGLRKWISTEGKKFLHEQRQQKLQPVANLVIAEETEVEEELASPAVDGPVQVQSYPVVQQPVAANGYSSSMEHDEASIRLKNMLHFGPPKEQVDQSSARLMNMLGGGVGGVGGGEISEHPITREHPNIAQLGPNPRALLSMLRTGDGSGALNQAPQVNRLTSTQVPNHAPQPPPYQGFSLPSPPQGSEFFHQIPQRPQPIQQHRNPPPRLRNRGGIGAGAGWPQFPRGIPENPPSPPPTSSFTGPSQTAPPHLQSGHSTPLPPPQNHTTYPPPPPYQPNFSPLNRNGFKPPSYPQPTPQLPLTPLEVFIPPPVLSKPPDLGQAGTLLSILKGATPAPAQAAHAPPPATPTRKPSTPTPAPAQTSPQKPLTPKGPQAQRNQQNKNTPPPPSSTQSGFNPPSRPSTTHSPFRTSSAGYGPPKTKTPVQGLAFDRRESVSNEQQQTLLAMFRTGTPGQPTTGLNDEAVMSSPEQSPARPSRVRSMSGGSRSGSRMGRKAKGVETPRSPLGKERERESLMKYLEGVANGAGQ